MTEPKYWDRFYAENHPDLQEPSSFARLCVSQTPLGASIFEIGCGNGRDALFMARCNLRVHASDRSAIAISRVAKLAEGLDVQHAPKLIVRPIEELDDRHAGTLDAVYMRFVLHAVTAGVASVGLRWAFRNLRPGGILFIEARSILGSLYGNGTPAGRDAFIHDGHYRRFIRRDELRDELVGIGFRLDHLAEAAGLAMRGNDDPVVVRAFAARPTTATT